MLKSMSPHTEHTKRTKHTKTTTFNLTLSLVADNLVQFSLISIWFSFNFVVKHDGKTDYTIKITHYDSYTNTWHESPDDDCSWSTYTLDEELTEISASLYEYEASKLEGWNFTHSSSEKLKGTLSSSGCYNYRVKTPFWGELLEGDMDNFARRTARRVSRIVFHQEY